MQYVICCVCRRPVAVAQNCLWDGSFLSGMCSCVEIRSLRHSQECRVHTETERSPLLATWKAAYHLTVPAALRGPDKIPSVPPGSRKVTDLLSWGASSDTCTPWERTVGTVSIRLSVSFQVLFARHCPPKSPEPQTQAPTSPLLAPRPAGEPNASPEPTLPHQVSMTKAAIYAARRCLFIARICAKR